MIGFRDITPTVFMREQNGALEQLIELRLVNDGLDTEAQLRIDLSGKDIAYKLTVPAGESKHDVYIPEVGRQCIAGFVIQSNGVPSSSREITLEVQRKWVVHVVQNSHHDPGYTDLPSLVLREHDRWLDEAIEIAEKTSSFPDDSRFRIVIEQTWSIYHFIKNMPEERVRKIVSLMRDGYFELTALFGNMITELCGHEELARTAYHAFSLRRDYGIPILSAEHNDIPGISWGLSRVLTDSGIKIFCPGLPLYYGWHEKFKMQSFWDQKKIFGHDGPGAFWWESPAGKRVLFWCNNNGCCGSFYGTMPALANSLKRFEAQGYPWEVVRWPVIGGARDNSPYIGDYAQTIKEWNEKWAYPKLVSSTNTKFYQDFIKQDLSELPVWRGELPGQDYPMGAISTAAATAVNRNNHSSLPSAEILSCASSLYTGSDYPQSIINEAYEEALWHDEHAFGYHFPCGPAMRTSEQEKELHAYRAETLAHDTANKAMAGLTDSLKLEDGYHLVVFNTTSWPCTAPVCAPMREIDNSSSKMRYVPPEKDGMGLGFLKGYILNDRWHTVLPQEFFDGNFDLVDVLTGKEVDYQIVPVKSHMDPLPYSPERLGLGSGSQRIASFEEPEGLKYDLCFIAQDVPSLGYRAYKLFPKSRTLLKESITQAQGIIANEYYTVTVNGEGAVTSIFDRKANREITDPSCAHGFFGMIVREGNSESVMSEECLGVQVETGAVRSLIRIKSKIYGHPEVEKTITLYKGIKQVYCALKALKDSKPLLNTHVSFPFSLAEPEFRYEGSLSVMNPIEDFLPEAYSDIITVQNWVKVKDGGFSMLWSSLDAPVAGFGKLWPGHVSPAHRCITDENADHPPQKKEDLDKGWIYSQLYNNNFGTNFSVSQCGETLFRFVFSSAEGDIDDAFAARFGWQAVSPLMPLLTDRGKPERVLAPCGSLIDIKNDKVALLSWKKAEDGAGDIIRLWNMSDHNEKVRITFPSIRKMQMNRTNLCEEDVEEALTYEGDSVEVAISGKDVVALRFRFQ